MQHFLAKLNFGYVSRAIIYRSFKMSQSFPLVRKYGQAEDVSTIISSLYHVLMDACCLLLLIMLMLPIWQCLYLNIKTPDASLWDLDPHAQRRKLLPVIVFFHGGDFQDGSGGRRYFYSSHALPVYGNVVLVTFNYRCAAQSIARIRVVKPEFGGVHI